MDYTSGDITFIGGKFTLESLDIFLKAWNFHTLDMYYCLWETIETGIHFDVSSPYFSINKTLMRLHVFGEGGDLTLRRDEVDFYWRYIGQALHTYPPIDYSNFWDFYPQKLVGHERTALLWGRLGDNPSYPEHWHENRVGAAISRLRYPGNNINRSERVEVQAEALLNPHDLSVVAVWSKRLMEHKELEK